MSHETQRGQSVVDGDTDNPFANQMLRIVSRGVSEIEATAMYPHHDRTSCVNTERFAKHIQVQTVFCVFSRPRFRQIDGKPLRHGFKILIGLSLQAGRTKPLCLSDTRP